MKYYYLTKVDTNDILIVESPYKITEDTQTFGGTIVYTNGKSSVEDIPLAKVGQHSNNWMADEFELIPEDEAKLLISYHKSNKPTQIRNIILHASRDYDMKFDDVERILDRNELPSKFYEELEKFVKERSES